MVKGARPPALLNRCVTGERLRESSKIIGMAKCFGHFLLSLNNYYLSLWHSLPSAAVCGLRPSLLPRSFVPESKLSHNGRAINGFARRPPDCIRGKNIKNNILLFFSLVKVTRELFFIVFAAGMAEFLPRQASQSAERRNETVLRLRSQCESLLSSTVPEVQYGSLKSSAITAGFFMFFSSLIYFRKLNYELESQQVRGRAQQHDD